MLCPWCGRRKHNQRDLDICTFEMVSALYRHQITLEDGGKVE